MTILKRANFSALIYQSIGRISVQLLGFILGIVIVRFSGLELYGAYAKYNALINISFGVCASGVCDHYLRANNIKLLWKTVLGTTILLLFFLFVISPLYSYIANDSLLNIILALSSIYLMKLSEVYIVSTRFIGKDIRSIFPRAIPYMLLIVLFLLIKPSNITAFLSLVFSSWIVSFFYILSLKNYFIVKKIDLKSIFSDTVLLSISVLTTQIYANFDQLMISKLLGNKDLGVYKVGLSFSVLAMPVIGVFSFIYLSNLKEKLNAESACSIKNSFYNQIKINFLVSFIFVIFLSLFLNKIIEVFYDIKDKRAYYVGIIMATGVVFNVLLMVFSYTLLAVKKDKEIVLITIIGAVTNILLNFLFITSYGILGAAWASLVTQGLMLILFIYAFYCKIEFLKKFKTLI